MVIERVPVGIQHSSSVSVNHRVVVGKLAREGQGKDRESTTAPGLNRIQRE